MNIRDLKYLVALSEHQHFSKAADACFVSQPALSMQIKKLEELLDLQLLERTNKSVLFTPEGLMIVDRAKQILNQVDEVFAIAKQVKDPYSGELKIGIFPTLAPYLLPTIMQPLAKKFPKLSFYLIEEKTGLLLEKLKSGKTDAIIIALPLTDNSLNSAQLFEEPFMLAVPKKHDLAKRKFINQQDLNSKDLLLLEDGHCLREQALAVCHKLHANEVQDFRATSLETLRHMVAAGVGITLIPSLACTTNSNISYIPFNKPKPARSIALVWRKESAKNNLLQELAEHIRSSTKKLNSVETYN